MKNRCLVPITILLTACVNVSRYGKNYEENIDVRFISNHNNIEFKIVNPLQNQKITDENGIISNVNDLPYFIKDLDWKIANGMIKQKKAGEYFLIINCRNHLERQHIIIKKSSSVQKFTVQCSDYADSE